jgi:hypothetical protein
MCGGSIGKFSDELSAQAPKGGELGKLSKLGDKGKDRLNLNIKQTSNRNNLSLDAQGSTKELSGWTEESLMKASHHAFGSHIPGYGGDDDRFKNPFAKGGDGGGGDGDGTSSGSSDNTLENEEDVNFARLMASRKLKQSRGRSSLLSQGSAQNITA